MRVSTKTLAIVLAAILVSLLQSSFHADTAFAQEASEPGGEQAVGTDADLTRLIEALRDEETRERILLSLEGTLEPRETAAEADADSPPQTLSIGRRIADFTGAAAEGMAARVGAILAQIGRIPELVSALEPGRLDGLLRSLADLLILVAATYGVFWVLRSGAKRAFAAIDRRSAGSATLRWLVTVAVSVVFDLIVVAAAWAVGYLITLTVLGTTGAVGLRQTLFLNAFLIVEALKVVVRFFLAPSAPALRVVGVGDATALHLNRWFGAIIALLGFGQLLFMPVTNATVSFAAGQAVSVLFSLAALAVAIWLVLHNRLQVRDHLLTGRGERGQSRQRRFYAHFWHWPALLLLGFLGIVILTQPFQALLSLLWSGMQVLVALFVGFLVTGWIASGISRGVSLPSGVNERLPLLEQRLNSLVPKLLTVVRIVISIIVLAFVVHTVGLIDMRTWLESNIGLQLTGAVVSIAFILLFSFALWLALTSWVDYRLNPGFGKVATARESTLLTLLRNAVTIVLIVIALMFSLSELGIDIAPLLASAGVLGLAIGFGAQKLVQDIITGIFIQLENAINVGDVISVGGTTGTVERLTIRSVSLRDVQGSYHIIPFSSVDMVTNFMREFAYHVADVGVAYREDVDEAKQALFDAYEEMRNEPAQAPFLHGDMDWFGVQSLGDSAVVLRTRIKTAPGKQWAIGRAFNQHVKKVFDERGIEIPFPHQTLYFGEGKDGKAPSARVKVLEAGRGMRDASEHSAGNDEAGTPARTVEADADRNASADTGKE